MNGHASAFVVSYIGWNKIKNKTFDNWHTLLHVNMRSFSAFPKERKMILLGSRKNDGSIHQIFMYTTALEMALHAKKKRVDI